MIEEKVSRMNRIAMGLFIAAVVVFVIFHFLPWSNSYRQVSWKIWPFLIQRQNFTGRGLLPTSGFIANALLVISSPFLMRIFPASRLARRFCQIVTLMAFVSLSGFLVWNEEPLGPGVISIVVAQTLHLAGSLCLRGASAPEEPFRCDT